MAFIQILDLFWLISFFVHNVVINSFSVSTTGFKLSVKI